MSKLNGERIHPETRLRLGIALVFGLAIMLFFGACSEGTLSKSAGTYSAENYKKLEGKPLSEILGLKSIVASEDSLTVEDSTDESR